MAQLQCSTAHTIESTRTNIHRRAYHQAPFSTSPTAAPPIAGLAPYLQSQHIHIHHRLESTFSHYFMPSCMAPLRFPSTDLILLLYLNFAFCISSLALCSFWSTLCHAAYAPSFRGGLLDLEVTPMYLYFNLERNRISFTRNLGIWYFNLAGSSAEDLR